MNNNFERQGAKDILSNISKLQSVPTSPDNASSYLDFYKELLAEELRTLFYFPPDSQWFKKRLSNLSDAVDNLSNLVETNPYVSENELASEFLSTDPVSNYPSKYSMATLTITDLARHLFPFFEHRVPSKAVFRTMGKARDAVLPYLFEKSEVSEDQSLLRRYVNSIFDIEEYPFNGYLNYTDGVALGKVDKHLYSAYSDEHTLERMEQVYEALDYFLNMLDSSGFKEKVRAVAVGGSFGRLLRKGYSPEKAEEIKDSLLGFDDASDLDLILFTDAQSDSVLSDQKLLMDLRSLSKEVSQEYGVEVCEGGRIPSVDIEEIGIWDYTNPVGLANYIGDHGLHPLSLAYTNVHYGKLIAGHKWFNENILPIFQLYERVFLPQKQAEFQSIMR